MRNDQIPNGTERLIYWTTTARHSSRLPAASPKLKPDSDLLHR